MLLLDLLQQRESVHARHPHRNRFGLAAFECFDHAVRVGEQVTRIPALVRPLEQPIGSSGRRRSPIPGWSQSRGQAPCCSTRW